MVDTYNIRARARGRKRSTRTIAGAIALVLPMPLTAVMLLWINLVATGALDKALALEKGDPDVMRRPPRSPNEPMSTRRALAGLAFMGLWMAAGTLAIFAWELSTGTPLAHAQTEAFTVSATFQAFSAFCFRSADRPIYQLPPNWWLFGGALLAFGIQCLAVYLPPLQSFLGTVPLQPWEFALSVGAGFTLLILAEIYKVLQQQLRRNQ